MGRASSLILLAAVGVLVYAPPSATRPEAQDRPVRRIVSLVPSLTELVYEAGAGDLLVGCSRACNHPAETARVEKIGDVLVDHERVLALRPDVVLTSEELLARPNAALEARGVRVVRMDPRTWEEIAEAMRAIARMAGRPERGAARFLERARPRPARGLRAAYLEVSPRAILAAGPGSTADLVIRTAGMTNVFGHLRKDWDWIDSETLLRAAPELLIVTPESREALGTRAGLRARIVEANGDIWMRAGPRLVEALEQLDP
jgi:iron complex transport system substrate-binding protein